MIGLTNLASKYSIATAEEIIGFCYSGMASLSRTINMIAFLSDYGTKESQAPQVNWSTLASSLKETSKTRFQWEIKDTLILFFPLNSD